MPYQQERELFILGRSEMITRIEVLFAVPVELTDAEQRQLYEMADKIARRHQAEGRVHWASGCGSKPIFSQQDRGMVHPSLIGEKEHGEPDWDDAVFFIETCERED
jgi:hypothetical protein